GGGAYGDTALVGELDVVGQADSLTAVFVVGDFDVRARYCLGAVLAIPTISTTQGLEPGFLVAFETVGYCHLISGATVLAIPTIDSIFAVYAIPTCRTFWTLWAFGAWATLT